jgi:1,2-dihydroxy-3-keto-5-methylthiopentene dioxygenase
MTVLKIYNENETHPTKTDNDVATIARSLAEIGVHFARWETDKSLAAGASQEEILEAYRDSVAQLCREYGFKSVDVISVKPDHPDRKALREKFLSEHTHQDFEVRFFVEGRGQFYLHKQGKVFSLLCEQGDLISVPAGMAHWFDMGEEPNLKCIRFFTTPEGWVANFTGEDIAERFPRLG